MRIINLVSYFTLISAMLLVLVFGYWYLYPYRTLELNTKTYPILNENKVVKQGERLIYQVDACKYTDVIPDLTKFFVDGVIYETPKSIGAIEKGCHVKNIDVYVPRAIPTGVYHMKFVARYEVNPIRTIEVINYSDEFRVVK